MKCRIKNNLKVYPLLKKIRFQAIIFNFKTR